MELERDQQLLLADMVEAARTVPRHEQEWHLGGESVAENLLSGPWGERLVLISDLEALSDAGLLDAVKLNYVYGNDYVITASGYRYADELRARLTAPADDQPTGWDAVDAAVDRLRRLVQEAKDEQDFKGVGHQSVTVLEVLGRTAFDPARHMPPDESEPAPNDANRRIGLIIASMQGGRYAHVRKIVRGAWDQTQEIKHRNEPDAVDAGIAADAVILVVAMVRRLVGDESTPAARSALENGE